MNDDDFATGCVHRVNYDVMVGLRVEFEGQGAFAAETREQAFQDWYFMTHGTGHPEPCRERPVWVRSVVLPS